MPMRVELVSPEETMYSDEATMVVARTRGGGEIAFLAGHEPFIGSLQMSEVRVTSTSGAVRRFAARGGFVSVAGTVNDSTVTILSDAAVAVESIKRDRVEAALADARAALAAAPDDPYARDDVRWAELQLSVLDQQRSSAGH